MSDNYIKTAHKKPLKEKKNILTRGKHAKSVQNFLPKTGINQLFMIHKMKFIKTHKQYEHLNEGYLTCKLLIEDYR